MKQIDAIMANEVFQHLPEELQSRWKGCQSRANTNRKIHIRVS